MVVVNNSINAPLPLAIAQGGTATGVTPNTQGVFYFDGTKFVSTTSGTSGQVLTSNGSSSAPTFQSVSLPVTGFFAYLSPGSTSLASNSIVPFDVADYDPTSSFTTGGSAKYTAPVTGLYTITLQLSSSSATSLSLVLTSISHSSGSFPISVTSVTSNIFNGVIQVPMYVGDSISAQIGTTMIVSGGTGPFKTWISGSLTSI